MTSVSENSKDFDGGVGGPAHGYVLGIDLGTNSCGWAAVHRDGAGHPAGVLAAGVRVFQQGTEGDIASGRDSSRNVKRRDSRQARRQGERRRRRRLKVFHILQRAALLPPGTSANEVFDTLDRELLDNYVREAGVSRDRLSSTLPYFLRKRALDERLAPYELGRVFYHLAQRRGFVSNRRSPVKDDEELGKVQEGITELEKAMADRGARTLGELFAGLDPRTERVRRRWTSRAMFEKEFDAIWDAQSVHYPGLLSEDLRAALRHALFYQRPLKIQRHLVGECELEPGRSRAPKALLIVQRWRILQNVNNMRLVHRDSGEQKDLTSEQRLALVEVLDNQGSLTFGKARKLLGLGPGWTFNLEEGDRKKLEGNTTAERLRKIFGSRWDTMGADERDQVVDDLRSISDVGAMLRRGMGSWGLDEDAASALANCKLEAGYVSLSRQAVEKVMPFLEDGLTFAEARLQAYPGTNKSAKALDLLPPLEGPRAVRLQALRSLRNPVVSRSLTELRKVVNSLVSQYGKPDMIRIELARDLKRPRGEREDIWKQQRQNQKARDRAAARIVSEVGISEPSRDDVDRVLLADEQAWVCPYSGRSISIGALLGSASQFDVDHIIPWSISFDDSFANKVVCFNEENRLKGNRTPRQAYGGDPSRWAQILARAERFKEHTGLRGYRKWQRFQWDDEAVEKRYGGFSERQLNDTRYASRLAADYLGLLFGGRVDAQHALRVQVGQGKVTARLRQAWDIEGVLSASPGKSRADHRHHAIDAIVIALTTPELLAAFSREAAREDERRAPGTRNVVHLAEPWPGFMEEVRDEITAIVPSHQRSGRVRGALHEETLYSEPIIASDNASVLRHVRKSVRTLSASEIDKIVDQRVRAVVREKVAEVGGKADKLSDDDPPVIQSGAGGSVPVRRVRVARGASKVTPVGTGDRERQVEPRNNHHVEIFEVDDAKGGIEWKARVVTLLEATQRQRDGKVIVDRTWAGPGTGRFLFSLVQGDTVETADGLFVVGSFWDTPSGVRLSYTPICDARSKKDISRSGREPSLSTLHKVACAKVVVDPIGKVHPAHD